MKEQGTRLFALPLCGRPSSPTLGIVLRALLVAGSAHAVERYYEGIPRFEDFPGPPSFRGTNAKPDLSSRLARLYRTRLREGAKRKPNYAGIHNLVLWGCGTACRTGAAVNTVTGRVVFLPGLALGIHARADSRLLVLSSQRIPGEVALHCFYDFDGREFRLVKVIDGGAEGYWPPMACSAYAGIDRTPDGKLLIVRESSGGSVDQFERIKRRADRSGTSIRLEGPCQSACTIFLSAKNVCVAEIAEIGVHGASRGGELDAALTQEWARKFHPPALREWAEKVGAYESVRMTTLQAPDLWNMGFERCRPLADDVKQELAERRARERAELLAFVEGVEHENTKVGGAK